MGRASFGGAQDLSAAFAGFYRQYQDQIETLARRGEARAQEEQAAKDGDVIDRWQSGDMTDAQFLRYAERRVEQSGGIDPEAEAYWKKTLRDAQKSIVAEGITDKAEDLINDIEAGTKTWADLLDFYRKSRGGLEKNDPLRKDIEAQMEEVRDRVKQNEVEGRFAQIQYQFEAGRLSGTAAASQIRELAQRYKQNDPARYYQMLQQALDLQRFGGTYGSGGSSGSSGGSSSRGSSSGSASNLDTIDQIKIREDQLLALSYQYQDGVKVGEATVVDGRGRVHTQEVLLANPDGSPSDTMAQLDDAMLKNYDQGISLLVKDGSTEAGTWIKAKSTYITDHIQPRNTVVPQKQAESMLSSGIALVESAANSDDPVAAWGKVRAWAKDVDRWNQGLNRNLKHHNITGKPLSVLRELAKGQSDEALTTTAKEKGLEDRTTENFAGQAAALQAFALAVASGDEAGMRKALEGFDTTQTDDTLEREFGASVVSNPMADRLSAAIDLVRGIPEGRYTRVYVPGEGLVYTPVQQTIATVIGPDGKPQAVQQSIPIRPDGSPIADGTKGEELVDMMLEVNGQVQMVKAVAQPAYFVGDRAVSAAEYASSLKAYTEAQSNPTPESAALPVPTSYQQVLLPGRGGSQPEVWLFDGARGLWFKNKVDKYGGVPLIFNGKSGELAQEAATKLGVDQSGTAYFTPDPNKEMLDAKKLWYDQARGHSRQDALQAKRAEYAEEFRGLNRGAMQALGGGVGFGANVAGSLPGFAGDFLSNSLRAVGAQLGIKTFDDKKDQPNQITSSLPPEIANLHDARVDRANLPPVRKALPRIELPPIRPPVRKSLPDLTSDQNSTSDSDRRRRRRRRRNNDGPPPTQTGKADNILGALL